MAKKTNDALAYLRNLIKSTNNDLASVVEDGVLAGDFETFIDTGSYIVNALLSGSIYGGVASNKVTALAGPSSTGKTYFLLGIIRQFLETNKNANVVLFETEGALTRDIIEKRGIDMTRMGIVPIDTIQSFRTQIISILDRHYETPESERPLLLLGLDSLGNLESKKALEDATAGKDTQDMTRARLIKGLFRIITLKLSKVKVPLIVTNHTYSQIGAMFPVEILGGGTGLQYAASTIIFLSKRKDKDGTDVVGNIIHCKNYKNRLAKENKIVDTVLNYDTGLNRYYGLAELAVKHGLFKDLGKRLELPDGTKAFLKTINRNPEKYYTQELLEEIEKLAQKEFLYGMGEDLEQNEESSEFEESESCEE